MCVTTVVSVCDYSGSLQVWSCTRHYNYFRWMRNFVSNFGTVPKNVGKRPDPFLWGVVWARDYSMYYMIFTFTAYTPCSRNNGGCSHVCVTKYRDSSRVRQVCMCPIGYPLLSNKRTCASGEYDGMSIEPR